MLTDCTGETITLSEADTLVAGRALNALAKMPLAAMPEHLHLNDLPEDIVIPKAMLPLMTQILEAMSKGERVRLLAESREVTPQQVAEMLGVSRPLVMHILKQGVIPSRRVGTHYRVRLQDVLSYQQEKQRRGELLDQLTHEAEDLDLGY